MRFAELARRIAHAEEARGAARIEPFEQEVHATGNGGYDISFRQRLKSEDDNAAMSLATNLAIADALYARRNGLVQGHARARSACRAATATHSASLRHRMAGGPLRCAISSVR